MAQADLEELYPPHAAALDGRPYTDAPSRRRAPSPALRGPPPARPVRPAHSPGPAPHPPGPATASRVPFSSRLTPHTRAPAGLGSLTAPLPESAPRPFSLPSNGNSRPPPSPPASRARLRGGGRRAARNPGARAPPAAPGKATASPVEGRAGPDRGAGWAGAPSPISARSRHARCGGPPRVARRKDVTGAAPQRRASSFLRTGRPPSVGAAGAWGGGGVPGERVSGGGRGPNPAPSPEGVGAGLSGHRRRERRDCF